MLNTQRFLLYCGWGMLILTVLGYIGLGPTPASSLFGSALYFDTPTNLGHLVIGALCLAAYYLARTDRWLRIWSGVVGAILLVAVVVGFLNQMAPAPNAGFANFELAENILYLLLSLWGFWVAFMPEGPMFVREQKTAEAK
jgi:hypothetical protein